MMRGCANNIIKGNYSTDPNCIEKCFHFLEELGSGGFGKVKLAIHLLTNEKVAIKIIDKKAVGHDLPRITAELEALKQLAHQHICRMYQYVETEDKFYVVMEYCNGGEMFDYIVRKERLTEPEARHFFRQLVQAIAYIHSLGFAHRDLKPENLLLTNEQQLKVIDFGLCARPLKGLDAVLETCCGSPAYAAPELLQNNYYFGNEADIWSMGVLLYTLLCGCLPFDDGSYPRLYQKIRKGVYLEPNYLTSDTKEFLRCMLTVDPKQRATIRQILAHPWLNKSYRQQIKWQSIYSRDIVDEDVCRELAYFYGCRLEEIIAQVRQWKYDYKTANYLILLQKKERKQNIALLSHKKIVKQPSALTIHGSLDNDLDLSGIDDFSSDGSFQNDEFLMAPTEKKMEAMALCCPSQIFAFSPQKKFLRQQLNGDQSLSISPLNLENSVKKHPICSNDKENQRPLPMPTTPKARNYHPNGAPLPIEKCGGDDISRPISIYTTPRRVIPNAVVCSSSAHRRPNSADRPSRNVATSHNQQKQRLADQQQQQRSNSSDRPCSFTPSPAPSYPRKARFDMRNELKTPGRLRQRMFSSLERKKEKIVNFLTPRRDRSSDAPAKLKCTKTMVNVSVTSSTDPAKVRDELVNVLRKHDIMPQQNGWKIFGSRKNAAGSGQTTVELEVVAIENMGYVGVKRKRIQGDAFTYKRICEEVLRMAGL